MKFQHRIAAALRSALARRARHLDHLGSVQRVAQPQDFVAAGVILRLAQQSIQFLQHLLVIRGRFLHGRQYMSEFVDYGWRRYTPAP